jgi:hypothetical protein
MLVHASPPPVDTYRHGRSVSSWRPPPAARVACGQGWRQDTKGEGHGTGSSGGTEIASASVVDSASGRCRSWHRIASPAHPTSIPIDADVPGFPMAADLGGLGGCRGPARLAMVGRPGRPVRLAVVNRPEGPQGFSRLPTRGMVARTVGWLGRDRRWSNDDKYWIPVLWCVGGMKGGAMDQHTIAIHLAVVEAHCGSEAARPGGRGGRA